MTKAKDIRTQADIHLLVDTFYDKVRHHPLIGPIFDKAIGDKWAEHLPKMYRFWETVLLEDQTYFGSPFPPHLRLALEAPHFEAWLGLWKETVQSLFSGDKADEAIWRAEKMAQMFIAKIDYYRNNTASPLI